MDRARAVRVAEKFGMPAVTIGVAAFVGRVIVAEQKAALERCYPDCPPPTGFQFDPATIGVAGVAFAVVVATAFFVSSPVVRDGETGKDGGEI
jgi:hypothetical protein